VDIVENLEKMAARYNADMIDAAAEYSAAVRIGTSTARVFPEMLKIAGWLAKSGAPVGSAMGGGMHAAEQLATRFAKPVVQAVDRAVPKVVGAAEKVSPVAANALPVVGNIKRPAANIGNLPTVATTPGTRSGIGVGSASAAAPAASSSSRASSKTGLFPGQYVDVHGTLGYHGPGFGPPPANSIVEHGMVRTASVVGRIKVSGAIGAATGATFSHAVPAMEKLIAQEAGTAVRAAEAPALSQLTKRVPTPLPRRGPPPVPAAAQEAVLQQKGERAISQLAQEPLPAVSPVAPQRVQQRAAKQQAKVQAQATAKEQAAARAAADVQARASQGFHGAIVDPSTAPNELVRQGRINVERPVAMPGASAPPGGKAPPELGNLASQQPPSPPTKGGIPWRAGAAVLGAGALVGGTAVGVPAMMGLRRAGQIHQNIQNSQYQPNIGPATFNQSYL